jgi:putative membrane protein
VRNSLNIKYILATLILLSVILSIQHITEYILTDKKDLMIKKLTEPFCYIHTGRTLSLLLGLILIDYSYWFILLTFTISQLFPSFISRSVHVRDINFNHLTTHLYIITNTVAISLWLSDLKINITTKIILLISIVFILLLAIYQKIFKTIDRTLTKQSGNTYIIGAYFTILELIFINLFFVLEYDWKYIPLCIICYSVSYQSFKHYKK